MATAGNPEEVFRFTTVRNPRPLTPDAAGDGVILIVPTRGEKNHEHYREMLELRRRGAPREDIIAYAEKVMSDPAFLMRLDGLQTAILVFGDRLAGLGAITAKTVRDLAQEVLGQATQDELASDRVVVADSLILSCVVTPPVPGLRGRLMRALRAIEVLRRLDVQEGPEPAARALTRTARATLLMPSALFPLPASRGREDANGEAEKRRRAQVAAAAKRAQALLDEIAQNEAVAAELTESLSVRLLTTRRAEGEAKLDTRADVLPVEEVARLSAAALETIKALRVPADAVEVPFVVQALELRNIGLGQELGAGFGDVLAESGPVILPGLGECGGPVIPEPKPENDFTPDTRGEVELVGIQDLMIVRQALREYRPGEIAHIENVMLGERKSKTHRKLDRSEVTFFEENEREKQVEDELQTTEKFELQTESSRVIKEDTSTEAGVTVTASYGTVDIEAHGNYASSTSTTESRDSASTYARDVVSRSLQKIRERVLTRRSRTDITEVEVVNEHEFDNTDGTGHVRGVYRWVDKFYEAQIVNYGKRTMLEFMVPDPAAFTRFAAENRPALANAVEKPDEPGFCRDGVFHPLTPGDLTAENYLFFVGKYRVGDAVAPLPRYARASDAMKFKVDITDGNPLTFAELNDGFKVPDGYTPRSVAYTIAGGNSHSATTKNDDHDDIILAVVTVGRTRVFRFYKSEIGEAGGEDVWEDLTQTIEWDGGALSPREQQFGGYVVGGLAGSIVLDPVGTNPGDTDAVKVSLTGHTTLSMSVSIHYTVLCERTEAKFRQWQVDTFTAIQTAYLGMKQEYEASLQAQESVGLTTIQGRNPLLNRELEKRELKKSAISLLTGQQYESFNAMGYDHVTGMPQIDLADAAAEGRFVRFFEQALEWRHITYLFYPYFWADKRGWTRAVSVQDADPLFEQFLQAGFARVWVPVRPGFEPLITNYIQTGGEPWTEKDAPLVEEEGAEAPFLSIIEEMKDLLGADFESRPGTLRLRHDDADVQGSGTDLVGDDVDREILIQLQPYRIAEVDVAAQTLRLADPYEGEDEDAARFGVGVKFVGEPWLVQVPTTLVHLQADSELASG